MKQYGTMKDFIMEGMSNAFFKKWFISGIKDEICAQVLMDLPQTWLEAIEWAKESQHIVFT
jgi:hypothetical protein